MKRINQFIFILFLAIGCTQQSNKSTFQGNTHIIGQWYTKDMKWPHWVMFDSLNNFYRWSFDEEIPENPEAKYIVKDSTITFSYLPLDTYSPTDDEDFVRPLELKFINENSFTILPLDSGLMSTFIYERAEFESPSYAEIYILKLTDAEADSLQSEIPNYQVSEDSIFTDAFYLLEHSWIRYQSIDSTSITLKNGSTYNKFDLGGYGIIYFTNDSTYIRKGFPKRQEFQSEIDSFFHFINRIPSFGN